MKARQPIACSNQLPIAARSSVKRWLTTSKRVRSPSQKRRNFSILHRVVETPEHFYERVTNLRSIAKVQRPPCSLLQVIRSIEVVAEARPLVQQIRTSKRLNQQVEVRFEGLAKPLVRQIACLERAQMLLLQSRCLVQEAQKLLRTEIKKTR